MCYSHIHILPPDLIMENYLTEFSCFTIWFVTASSVAECFEFRIPRFSFPSFPISSFFVSGFTSSRNLASLYDRIVDRTSHACTFFPVCGKTDIITVWGNALASCLACEVIVCFGRSQCQTVSFATVITLISASLFHQLHVLYMCTGITTPTIHQLTEELAGMNDWYSLGVALLVPVGKLKEIITSCPQEGTARWRIDLLQYWLESTPTASWSDIIAALEKIGHHTLSTRLRSKYLPSSATTTTGMSILHVVHTVISVLLSSYPVHVCTVGLSI